MSQFKVDLCDPWKHLDPQLLVYEFIVHGLCDATSAHANYMHLVNITSWADLDSQVFCPFTWFHILYITLFSELKTMWHGPEHAKDKDVLEVFT